MRRTRTIPAAPGMGRTSTPAACVRVTCAGRRVGGDLLRTPARLHAEACVPAADARHSFVGDEADAGIDVTGYPLSRPGVLHASVDTERRHLQRVLLRGRG